MPCRGVRGAITVDANDRDQILTATRQLLALMIRQNGISQDDAASVIFSCTDDVNAEFPALAARQLGWFDVPLLCTNEVRVPGSLPRCIRILIHWNTEKSSADVQHVYMRNATRLRPDINQLPPVDLEDLERWIEAYMSGGTAPGQS